MNNAKKNVKNCHCIITPVIPQIIYIEIRSSSKYSWENRTYVLFDLEVISLSNLYQYEIEEKNYIEFF